MSDEVLRDLARRAGIAVEWQDYAGRPKVVAADVLKRVLAALGLPADTSRELSSSRRLLTKRSSLADLPPLVTAVAGRPTRLDVGGNEAQAAELLLERGETRSVSLLPARGRLRIPAVAEIGYHRLRVEDREIVLAVSPARCRSIEDVVPDARLWGLSAQLYGLSHPGDVGIGDLAGAADLARAAGLKGADAIALSPMHALYAADPARFGPYAPSSRLFLNPLYAAPGLVFGQGVGGAAVLILLVGTVDLGAVLLVAAMGMAGFLSGMISPSRDMLVRAASPPGAFGRVFGIVTTGFNIGGTIGPLIGGWIMDHNLPRWVFFSSVLFMAMTSLMALASDWRSRRRTSREITV